MTHPLRDRLLDRDAGLKAALTGALPAMALIATGAGLPAILDAIVREVQMDHPDIIGSILILHEGRLFNGAAPGLPDFFNEAANGLTIGPAAGSCGTAAYRRERVIVTDIKTDPLWAEYRDTALRAGMRSCWSEPIRGADDRILGTFAMYRRRPGSPSVEEMDTISAAAHLASIAIERAQSEEALTASEARAQRARREAEAHTQRLKVALSAAKAAVVEVDYEEEAVWTSPEFIEISGTEMSYQQARQAVWPFVHPEDAPMIRCAVRAWLDGAPPEPLEVRVIEASGAEKWISICTEIQKGSTGRWSRTISLLLDIDQRKRQELALIAAEKAALAAAETKALFLANMSHEIRTPLNGVLTMAQLMTHGALDDEQRGKLDIILQSGRDLLHLINDILDFSKIEAGKLELECVEFDPEQILESTVASFKAVAERKHLKLEVEVSPQARGLRMGDPARLRQIAGNFISNALKFTATGGVFISIEGEGEGGRDGLTLAVRDTGMGIAPEKMSLLFQKFSQIDASTTRQFGGTGLGLAICSELAALMGGYVWAESVTGEGSTFYVTLAMPWVGAEMVADRTTIEIRPPAEEGPALRILAAEDNPTNQVVLRTIMSVFGFELTLVSNGQEAIDTWAEGGFDLILMDVQMPVVDGLEATKAIRAAEARRGLRRTPIVALSANAFRHQIEDYLAAGMDAHVAKPIELTTLHEVLQRVLTPADREATDRSPQSARA
jgi:signal transduction histidine kinase